jgi:hypothetical protein
VHAFRIKQLVGGGQQAISRCLAARSLWLDGGLSFGRLRRHVLDSKPTGLFDRLSSWLDLDYTAVRPPSTAKVAPVT